MFDTFDANDFAELRLRDPNDTKFPELFRYLNGLEIGEMTFVSDKQLKHRYDNISNGQQAIRNYAEHAGYSVSLRTGINTHDDRRGTFIKKTALNNK